MADTRLVKEISVKTFRPEENFELFIIYSVRKLEFSGENLSFHLVVNASANIHKSIDVY